MAFSVCSLCTPIVHVLSCLLLLLSCSPLQLSFCSSSNKDARMLMKRVKQQVTVCLTLSFLCVKTLLVDCLDPTCSGRGVCVQGECHCFVGWGGPGCESPRASCMDQCSGHGAFLADTGTCSCDPNWTGHDCSTGKCFHN